MQTHVVIQPTRLKAWDRSDGRCPSPVPSGRGEQSTSQSSCWRRTLRQLDGQWTCQQQRPERWHVRQDDAHAVRVRSRLWFLRNDTRSGMRAVLVHQRGGIRKDGSHHHHPRRHCAWEVRSAVVQELLYTIFETQYPITVTRMQKRGRIVVSDGCFPSFYSPSYLRTSHPQNFEIPIACIA